MRHSKADIALPPPVYSAFTGRAIEIARRFRMRAIRPEDHQVFSDGRRVAAVVTGGARVIYETTISEKKKNYGKQGEEMKYIRGKRKTKEKNV